MFVPLCYPEVVQVSETIWKKMNKIYVSFNDIRPR